jgi:hypothetical protein
MAKAVLLVFQPKKFKSGGQIMIKQILTELKIHSPFTILGALSGLVIMLFFQNVTYEVSYNIFYILHPIHVLLSALVTVSIYENYKCNREGSKCNLGILLFIGYIGSVGIATISDSLIPYIGETLLGLPNKGLHLGFIEKWWLVNPLAIIGIAIAYFRPSTKMPHLGHVLLSTWASLFHIFMALGKPIGLHIYLIVFMFLFIAVWLPCCLSDIVFPLLFVNKKVEENR